MDSEVAVALLISVIVMVVSTVVMFFTARAILTKAGFNPVLAWVAVAPGIGFWLIIGLLGLAEWPVERELEAILAQEQANA